MPIARFLPALRLSRLARRLLEQQSFPPRQVAFAEVWSVYAPLVIYQSAGLLVVIVAVLVISPLAARVPLAIGFAVLAVIEAIFWLGLTTIVRRALGAGTAATAEVIRAGTIWGAPRIRVNGREMALRTSFARSLKVGSQVPVLTNDKGDRLLLSLAA